MIRILLLVTLVGCTDRISVIEGECGNHILEVNEECDRPQGCTAECRYKCVVGLPTCPDDVPDGTCCPSDYRCGADGACRRPTGEFIESYVSVPFTSEPFGSFDVTDLDGDYIDDLLGVRSGSVIALYGSESAPFSTAIREAAPFANAVTALGDFTGDGVLDVILPTAGGLFAFETTQGVPRAIAFPDDTVTGVSHLFAASVSPLTALHVSHNGSGQVVAQLLPMGQRGLVCGVSLLVSHLANAGLPIFRTGGRTYSALGFDDGDAAKVCVLGPDPARLLSIPAGYRLRFASPLFVDHDVDPDTCPRLYVPVFNEATPTIPEVAIFNGVSVSGVCDVEQTASIATLSVPLAAVNVAGLSEPLFVTPAGVKRADNSFVFATREWTRAVTGDFDADGKQDFAAAAFDDDLEVFLQRGVPGAIEWRVVQITTSGVPVDFAAGDFDGDRRADIAFVTLDLANDEAGHIRVVYSEGNAFTDPTTFAIVPRFKQLASGDRVDPSINSALDQYDDLLVMFGGLSMISSSEATPARRATLFGSANRRMTAPWREAPSGVSITSQGALAVSIAPPRGDDPPSVIGVVQARNGHDLVRLVFDFEAGTFAPDLKVPAAPLPGDKNLRFVNIPHETGNVMFGLSRDQILPSSDGTQTCAGIFDESVGMLQSVRCQDVTTAPGGRDLVSFVDHLEVLPGRDTGTASQPHLLIIKRSTSELIK